MCWCRFVQAKPIDSGPLWKIFSPRSSATPSLGYPMGHFQEVYKRRHAEMTDSLDESVENIDGSPRIGKGTVRRRRRGVKKLRQRAELVVSDFFSGKH